MNKRRSNEIGSPVSVMNLAAVFTELDPFSAHSLDGRGLLAPQLLMVRKQQSHLHRQMDSVTASCTADEYHDDDDDHNDEADETGSLSSLSTKGLDDDECHLEQRDWRCDKMNKFVILPAHSRESLYERRSIFSHYWNSTGQQPLELLRDQAQILRSKSSSQLDQEAGGGDDEDHRCSSTIPSSCDSPATDTSPSSSRRSIFGLMVGCDDGLPAIPPLPGRAVLERRAQSISSPGGSSKTPLSSCLRHKKVKTKLDGSSREVSMASLPSTSSSFSAASVSFDERVRVYTFEKPLERWSDGSWTKMFAL